MESKQKKKKRWIIVTATVLLSALAFVGIRLIARSYVPDDVKALVATYEREHVHLSDEWHQPAELPPVDVINFFLNFNAKMVDFRAAHRSHFSGENGRENFSNRYKGPSLTEDERTSLSALMADLQPIIDEASVGVKLEGYTFEVDSHLMSEALVYNNAFLLAKLAPLVAYEHALNGDCEAALEVAALPLKMIRRPDQSYLINHLLGIGISSIAANSFYRLSEQCSDPASLKQALRLMADYRSSVVVDLTHFRYCELMTPLRFAAAYGYPVDLSPQSFASYLKQWGPLFDMSYFQWLADTLPADDPRKEIAQARVDESSRGGTNPTPLFYRSLATVVRVGTGMDLPAIAYASSPANFEEAETRVDNSLAEYDLTRIDIARRLAEVENASHITVYLNPVPGDPFSTGSFLFSKEQQKHYSVGPDKVDDRAQILYDATNGILSTGDIWMNVQ